MIVILILIAILLYMAYKWSTSTFDFFEKQGIPFRNPVPLFGTNINLLLRSKDFSESIDEMYYEFENEKCSGLFEFRRPAVLVRDPQIIKQLTIKDFDYFMDHRIMITEDIDPFLGKNLVSLSGQKWKDMRSTLSPAFTGSKMRQMFEFVSTVGIQTAETLKKDIENGSESVFEFKDFASKFTCDNIASCAFGIEINSFKNPSNDFYRLTKKILNFSGVKMALKFAGFLAFPKLMKLTKIKLLDKDICEFFEGAFYDTMRTREKLGIIRNDLINILLDVKKGKISHNVEENAADGFATVEESHFGKSSVNRKWDDIDLAAQCFIFFLAGFDTISQAMSFMAYELACNPDIQQRLYEEIFEMANEAEDQMINYDQLQSMKYLDQVVSETLRKWPPAPVMDRLCVKDYDLKYDDKVLKLEKNLNTLGIPIWSIQRDPKYFPDPEKFDPERFNDENKHKIQDCTYMPFGVGPRNCIGSRFALMEIKTIFFYLLFNFSIEVTEKTQIPLKFVKSQLVVKPEKGIWVELKSRTQ